MKRNIVQTIEEEYFAEDTIYAREERLHLIEDGEISPEEAAFMQGYEEAS